MFTGLIGDVGTVVAVEDRGALRRLRIRSSYPAQSIAIGASIACNGPCLTATDIEEIAGGSIVSVDVGVETLARTTARQWVEGTRLNLERSLKIGDELGGHIVTGHVDGTADLLAVEPIDEMTRFVIRVPGAYASFVAEKGSISLDGTSLTINTVDDDVLTVLLIPHSLRVTTWADRVIGDRLNFEVDLMARYAARLIETRGRTAPPSSA